MLKKIGIIVALCMFVVGCSSLKFAYGFVKTMVRERVETYLDIGENDVLALEAEISKLVSWHRAEMLPQYAVFLESQAQLAEGLGWNRAQIDEMIRMLRVMIKDTSQGSAIYLSLIHI